MSREKEVEHMIRTVITEFNRLTPREDWTAQLDLIRDSAAATVEYCDQSRPK